MPVAPLPNGRFMPRCDLPGCGWQPRFGSPNEANARRYLNSHLSERHRGAMGAVRDAATDAVKAWRTSPTHADTVEAMAFLEATLEALA